MRFGERSFCSYLCAVSRTETKSEFESRRRVRVATTDVRLSLKRWAFARYVSVLLHRFERVDVPNDTTVLPVVRLARFPPRV